MTLSVSTESTHYGGSAGRKLSDLLTQMEIINNII